MWRLSVSPSFLVVVFAALALSSYTSHGQSLGGCSHDPLPVFLNQYSYKGLYNEVHLQGYYHVNFTDAQSTLRFDADEEMMFRLVVAPSDVDVDILLFDTSDMENPVKTSETPGLAEEHLFRHSLPVGNYVIRLAYSGFEQSSRNECPTLLMELAIIPVSAMASRADDFSCPDTSGQVDYPLDDILAAAAAGETVTYDSSKDRKNYAAPVAHASQKSNVNFLKSFPLTVTRTDGASGLWDFSAQLGFDFPTSGNLGILLKPAAHEVSLSGCAMNQTCVIADIHQSNSKSMQALLTPGDYELWLYSEEFYMAGDVADCAPFSLKVLLTPVLEDMTPLNCPARVLPESLNAPGFLEDGYVKVDDVFLVSPSGGDNENRIQFTLDHSSFVRVTIFHGSIDLDIALEDAATGKVVASSTRFQGEDGILYRGMNGDYTIAVTYFGQPFIEVCETFHFKLEILPVTHAVEVECSSSEPDFSSLQSNVKESQRWSSSSTYCLDYNDDYAQRTFWSYQFTVDEVYAVEALLNFNFVLGALDLTIEDVDVDGASNVQGTSISDGQFVTGLLQPGTYKVSLSTEVTQSAGQLKEAHLEAMPSSVPYSLDWKMGRVKNGAKARCARIPLPTTLNTPAYLLTSHHVDVLERFAVPSFESTKEGATSMVETSVMYFEPGVDSLFRAVIERTDLLDIDMYLYEGSSDTVLVSGAEVYDESKWMAGGGYPEERVTYQLDAHQSYRLEVVFFNIDFSSSGKSIDTTCAEFSLEMALAPSATHEVGVRCGRTRNMPPSDLIPRATGAMWQSSGEYAFTQLAATAIDTRLEVAADVAVWLVVNIEYDFLFGDLSLQLLDKKNDTLAWGTNGRNFNQLGPVFVEPGTYTLQIYEPVPSVHDLKSCVNFTLFVAYGPESDVPEDLDAVLGCGSSAFGLPWTFNEPGYLDDSTTNMMHFQRDVLADMKEKMEGTQFTIPDSQGDWYFRVLAPKTEVGEFFDVDIYLYNGTADDHKTKNMIAYGVSMLETESFNERLSPGDYYFETRFYDWSSFLGDVSEEEEEVADQRECRYFPLEVALAPTSVLENLDLVIKKCEENVFPPAVLPQSNHYTKLPLFLTHGDATSNFITTDYTEVYFEVDADFLSGHITLTLESETHPTMDANVGFQVSYIDAVIPPGNYTLRLKPTRPMAKPNAPKCFPSAFKFRLKPFHIHNPDDTDSDGENTSDIPTSDGCVEFNRLPVNLYDTDGGSVDFGGPQAADGSLRMWGTDFYAADNRKDAYIRFKAPQKSYMRAFLNGENVDYDFKLYSNASDLAGSLIGASFGAAPVENALWMLDGQEDDYILNLHLFQLLDEGCLYYSLELAIRTVEALQEELACPVPMPNPHKPKRQRVIQAGKHVRQYHDNFVFAKGDMDDAYWYSKYNMSLSLEETTSLSTYIVYEFLANDFELQVRDSDDHLVAKGGSSGSVGRDEYLDFKNELDVVLEAGEYQLEIRQSSLDDNPIDFEDFCYRFGFSFVADAQNSTAPDDDTPHLINIDPPSGDHLNYAVDLQLTIRFSERVSKDSEIVVSLQHDQGEGIVATAPASETWTEGHTQLVVTWAPPFISAQAYHVAIDVNSFLSENGTPFEYEVTPSGSDLWFTMESECECGPHGECLGGACSCDDGYSLPSCDSCSEGYVPIGDVCVRRTACTSTLCHNGGDCSDTTGVATCSCPDAYTGDHCGLCAAGYSGTPCVATGEDEDKSIECHATLFPSTLDDPAYLGNDGHTHFQGNFYVDLVHRSHTTLFTLEHDSLFRIYSEPHWVDIDIWLYEVDVEGNILTTLTYQREINAEETAFLQLLGGTSTNPKYYQIKFGYYLWADAQAVNEECITANIELAIAPLSMIRADTSQDHISKACNDALLPFQDLTSTPENPMMIPAEGFDYGDPNNDNDYGTTYAVSPEAGAAFVRLPFATLANVGQKVRITVDLSYRFLVGDMAVLLQTGVEDATCVNSSRTVVFPSRHGDKALSCEPGRNYLNGHMLDIVVPPGLNYTIWLYQPTPQMEDVAECAVFNFRMVVQYITDDGDLFQCDAPRLPTTFNEPGYLGYDEQVPMHIAGSYHIDSEEIPFTLERESLFRVTVTSSDWFNLLLSAVGEDGTTRWLDFDQSGHGIRGSFVSRLPPGDYMFSVWGFDEYDSQMDGDLCSTIDFELAIVPSDVVEVCSGGQEILPFIPENVGSSFSIGTSDSARSSPISYLAFRPAPGNYPSDNDSEYSENMKKTKRSGYTESGRRVPTQRVVRNLIKQYKRRSRHAGTPVNMPQVFRELFSHFSSGVDSALRTDAETLTDQKDQRHSREVAADDYSDYYDSSSDGDHNSVYDPFSIYDESGGMEWFHRVAAYTFVIDELSYFNAEILSDFLTADVGLALAQLGDQNGEVTYGVSDTNRNYINTIIGPGSYSLHIYLTTPTRVLSTDVGLPECVAFNFLFSVDALATDNATNACLYFGEPVPNTFNSQRYLSSSREFVFQSPEFRVVSDQCALDHNIHAIHLTVAEPSVLRFFVEEHAVDVDLYLYGKVEDSKGNMVKTLLATSNNGFGAETLLAKVEPDVEYTVELIYFCWGFQPDPNMATCFYIDMEYAIEPIESLPAVCLTDDVWPPKIPKKSLPGTPYKFDSGMGSGDNLHFQQRGDEMRSHESKFSLDEAANVRVEVTYDFVKADLVLEIRNTNTDDSFVGTNWADRNVLLVKGLAAGSYVLTIKEPAPPLEETLGCASFGYSIVIESSLVSLREMLTSINPLPLTLNTINQLAYADNARMAGEFYIGDAKNDFWNMWDSMVFSVEEKSFVRVTLTFPSGLEYDYEPEIELYRCDKPVDGVWNNCGLHGSVEGDDAAAQAIFEVDEAGTFELYLGAPYISDVLDYVKTSAYINLAIEPVADLQKHIEASGEGISAGDCVDSVIPPIAINKAGAYAMRHDDLQLSAERRAQSLVFQTLDFTLEYDSVVFVSLGSYFILDEMWFSLRDGADSIDITTALKPTPNGNELQMTEFLVAGDYSISLGQYELLDSSLGLDHCTHYSLSLYIRKPTASAAQTPCVTQYILPTDLFTLVGGSTPYGGPVDSITGALDFHGSQFLQPDPTEVGGDIAVEMVKISLPKDSVVAIYTNPSVNAASSRVMPMLMCATDQCENPTEVMAHHAMGDSKSHVHVYEVKAHQEMTISMEFTDLDSRSSELATCPHYTLDVHVRSIVDLASESECEGTDATPASSIHVDKNGFGGITGPSAVPYDLSGDTYEIEFEVSERSYVDVSLAFNPLISFFDIDLIGASLNPDHRQATITPDTGDRLAITAHGLLTTPGIYSVRVHPTVYTKDTCAPIDLSIDIAPTNGKPYIGNVVPALSENTPVDVDLIVRFEASTGIYDKLGEKVNLQNSEPVASAFTLEPVEGSDGKKAIQCSSALSSSVGVYWTLLFPHDKLATDSSYRLTLADDMLFNDKGKAFVLPESFVGVYSTVSTDCNHRGHLSEDSGECSCDDGYTGHSCELCASGFARVMDGSCERRDDVPTETEPDMEPESEDWTTPEPESESELEPEPESEPSKPTPTPTTGIPTTDSPTTTAECDVCPDGQGTCEDGVCVCEDGFTGDDCHEDTGGDGHWYDDVKDILLADVRVTAIVGGSIGVICVMLTIFVVVCWRRRRKKAADGRYATLDEEIEMTSSVGRYDPQPDENLWEGDDDNF